MGRKRTPRMQAWSLKFQGTIHLIFLLSFNYQPSKIVMMRIQSSDVADFAIELIITNSYYQRPMFQKSMSSGRKIKTVSLSLRTEPRLASGESTSPPPFFAWHLPGFLDRPWVSCAQMRAAYTSQAILRSAGTCSSTVYPLILILTFMSSDDFCN